MRLPSELKIQIASYLTPRGIFALLIAFPTDSATSTVLYALGAGYTREQRVFENNPDDCAYRVYTPLQYFCSRGIERAVQRLLETGADPNEISFDETKGQIPPLVLAIAFRSAHVVSLLLQHGAWVDDRNDPAPDSDSVSVHRLYRRERPLDLAVGQPDRIFPRIHDQDGYRSRAGQLLQIVQLLLGAGVDVNGRNWKHQTALQTACAAITVDPLIVTALITAGADISCRANYAPRGVAMFGRRFSRWEGLSVALIHFAANTGNAAVLQILLDAGADVEARTRDGTRALDLAVLHMRRNIVQMLVQAGADVSVVITDGSGQATQLDPFKMVEETTTWDQLLEWFRVRGCQLWYGTLRKWLVQGEAPGASRRRIGTPNYSRRLIE